MLLAASVALGEGLSFLRCEGSVAAYYPAFAADHARLMSMACSEVVTFGEVCSRQL